MSPKVTKRKQRLFTPEFKAEAVRLVRGSGKTVAMVARELDLTATCLRAWVNQAEADEKGSGQGALTTDERAELTRLRRELRIVEQERDFLKNSGVLREDPVVRYAAIVAQVGVFTVAFMCRVLEVAPSGYYAARALAVEEVGSRRRSPGPRSRRLRSESSSLRQSAGPADLSAGGHRVGRKRVARLMEDGLRARQRRGFVLTTQSRHKFPIARNIVAREFEVSAPNQVWVSDLTYLRTQAGFVYMAVVLDLFARRVVGWAVSRELDAGIAVEALRRALALRSAPAGMVHHSDRGVHYACSDYRALLKSHDITPSMSRKADCWDNAVAESFFSSFGFELEFDANWRDVHDVERDAAEYIDGFYNPRRRHSHNTYLSPIDYEHQFMQQEIAS